MDILSKIKRLVLEPKIYAVLVRSVRGQVLHLGTHFSLEEAYAHARKRMEDLVPHKPGEAMDIELWNSMPARQAIAQITDPTKIDEVMKEVTSIQQVITPIANGAVFDMSELPPIIEELLKNSSPKSITQVKHPVNDEIPTLTDHIQDVKDSKNDLMQKLIDDADIAQVEKVATLLGAHSRRYVLKAIEKKLLKKSTTTPEITPKNENNKI